MTTEELHERLRGIKGCWDQALAQLEEVSGRCLVDWRQ